MKYIYFSAIALCLLSVESVSASSMFGYYPTYSTGYYGWGSGYAYAQPYYGYSNYRYASNGYRSCGYGGCNSGCGTVAPYTVSYGGCNSGCGTAVRYGGCNTACGTCGTTVSYGCGISNCCTNACYTNSCCDAVGSASPPTDTESDSSNRTFDPNEEDTSAPEYDEAPRNNPGPGGDFAAPSSSGIDWTKPRNPTGGESSEDGSSAPPSLFNPDGSLRTNDDGLIPPNEVDDAQGHGVNKPPMSNPVDEDGADDSSKDDQSTEQGSTGLGKETDIKDFLSPDTSVDRASASRSFRSSHIDVLSMHRLAGDSRNAGRSRTQVSSSSQDQRPARWISVPLPNGRIRL